MKKILVSGHFERTDQDYIILLETYTIGRDYINKKEFKQTRKENQVEMDINELRRLEQIYHIPPWLRTSRLQSMNSSKKTSRIDGRVPG